MRISDGSSDVCSSDLPSPRSAAVACNSHPTMLARACRRAAQMPCRSQNIWEEVMKLNRIAALLTTGIAATGAGFLPLSATAQDEEIGRASCRERVCQYV